MVCWLGMVERLRAVPSSDASLNSGKQPVEMIQECGESCRKVTPRAAGI